MPYKALHTSYYKYEIEVDKHRASVAMPYKALHTHGHEKQVTLLCANTQVRVERASGYLWRRVPPTETCTLSAGPEPPSPVTELTAGHVEIDKEGGGEEGYLAQFDLSWSPPLTANGALAEYEVNIVTQSSGDGSVLYHSIHPVSFPSLGTS